ncbi:MAG TPA: 3-deoxy-manno-octulosonate cytidylyltransferase [Gemmatimonadaceae bacterium]|nr:3-deoxy-manno-octulosonate cytidylyltransferase [Gemmatimonadaceae bacterium]
MGTLVVIPARLGAMRLPRKPLRLLSGLPLIVRVWQRISQMNVADAVVVATDDESVASAVRAVGAECVMTSDEHTSGTERVAEVASQPRFREYTTIVNVQGDEPFIGPGAVKGAAQLVSTGRFPLGTAASHASAEILDTPSLVKVVVADDGRAMYFSRAPIPYLRDKADASKRAQRTLQHIGVYAYSREALNEWVSLPPHPLEEIERLEQLRPLAAGLPMGVAVTSEAPASGIDTEEDLERANARWNAFIEGVVTNAG